MTGVDGRRVCRRWFHRWVFEEDFAEMSILLRCSRCGCRKVRVLL